MLSTELLTPSLLAKPAVCDLIAFGTVGAGRDALAELRRRPDAGATLPANLLKHADEQTVAGLAAVYRAIHDFALDPATFTDWGVLGGPRFLGRMATATVLSRFRADGAWGVSPHVIPNQTLHSQAGTISIALKIHGPNFGVGGGPDSESETLLAAAALLESQQVPAVWVVMSAWEPEPIPDDAGRNTRDDSVCHAVALALSQVGSPAFRRSLGAIRTTRRLRLYPGLTDGEGVPRLDVVTLAEALEATQPASRVWRLGTGGLLEFEHATMEGEDAL